MEQAKLLLLSMAERCLRIIQDRPEDPRFALQESLRPAHLRWMCKRIVEHADDWTVAKLERWIGFVQAGMIANCMLDLNGAKAMFDEIKQQFGPIAKDIDLLDHLDPGTSFEMELGGQG